MTDNKLNLVVLISGSGTNLQAIIDACKDESYPAKISLVLSNKQDAYGLVRAKSARLDTVIINHKDYASREEFDQAMNKEIQKHNPDLICLAGFMRLLTKEFTNKWQDKLINIHPSLLPDFKGINAQQQALDAGVKETGCTVHYVTEEMDAGPIILQKSVDVASDDTIESLTSKILVQEHKAYVEAIRLIANNKFNKPA